MIPQEIKSALANTQAAVKEASSNLTGPWPEDGTCVCIVSALNVWPTTFKRKDIELPGINIQFEYIHSEDSSTWKGCIGTIPANVDSVVAQLPDNLQRGVYAEMGRIVGALSHIVGEKVDDLLQGLERVDEILASDTVVEAEIKVASRDVTNAKGTVNTYHTDYINQVSLLASA